jgi:hypothetical protein
MSCSVLVVASTDGGRSHKCSRSGRDSVSGHSQAVITSVLTHRHSVRFVLDLDTTAKLSATMLVLKKMCCLHELLFSTRLR